MDQPGTGQQHSMNDDDSRTSLCCTMSYCSAGSWRSICRVSSIFLCRCIFHTRCRLLCVYRFFIPMIFGHSFMKLLCTSSTPLSLLEPESHSPPNYPRYSGIGFFSANKPQHLESRFAFRKSCLALYFRATIHGFPLSHMAFFIKDELKPLQLKNVILRPILRPILSYIYRG